MDAETSGGTGWVDAAEACSSMRTPPPTMKTIGYVIYEDDVYIALTDTVGPEETACINKIPKKMIVSSAYLTGGHDYEIGDRE